MTITWLELFADVPESDLDRDLTFWAAVHGATIGPVVGDHGEFVPLLAEGEDRFLFLQRVARAPGEGGWHLDLESDDHAADVVHAERLGAQVVTRGDVTVMSSPAGHVFCVIGAEGHARLPHPRSWPGGHTSRVDQVCFDTPAFDHDREVEFWAALTGWPRDRGDLQEFDRLVRPDHVPLRVLLQRLGVDDRGGPRTHADLAASGVGAERRRHVGLGAEVVLEAEHWTTLRDPAGLLYCITDRDPADS